MPAFGIYEIDPREDHFSCGVQKNGSKILGSTKMCPKMLGRQNLTFRKTKSQFNIISISLIQTKLNAVLAPFIVFFSFLSNVAKLSVRFNKFDFRKVLVVRVWVF